MMKSISTAVIPMAAVACMGCNPIFGIESAEVDAGARTTYAMEVLSDSPLAYFRLNEKEVGFAADAAPGGPNGTYKGTVMLDQPGAIVGDANTAARFDGNTGCVTAANKFDFQGTAVFSVEAWVRPIRDMSSIWGICSNDVEDASSKHQGYALGVDDQRRVLFERIVDDGYETASSNSQIAVDQFSHVVGTYDAERVSLFVNGELIDSRASSGVLATRPSVFVIGAQFACTNLFFPGTIDEVAVYARPLPTARIVAHYQRGIGE